MGFQCGIVGLPNVGKSTLFKALTKSNVGAENYPFCTIEPNVGVVPIPEARLDQLANIVKPERIISTAMRFVDIAGLVAGASKGEGLGNQFLGHIRETQAIAHIVRCYEDEDVTHVSGKVDPIADIETINTELALADLEAAEKAFVRLGKQAKSGDKKALAQQAVLERVKNYLAEGNPVRLLSFTKEEQALLKEYHFLTAKPVLYVANVSEEGMQNNPLLDAVSAFAEKESAPVLPICALIEAELAELSDEERRSFLADLGLEEPGLNRLIRAGHELLGLQTFFTAGVKEVRAWTVRQGATAPQAAGVIHGDFEKKFIRAEIIAFDDYVRCGGEQGAKEAGVWRLEGKDYIVQDGDVIYFRSG